MKKTLHYLLLAIIVGAGANVATAASKEKLTASVNEAKAQVIEKDGGFKDTFAKAAGYVIFPSVAKGGLGVGAAAGQGQVFEKEKLGGEASLRQVSVGFQAGGQAYTE